MVTYQSRQGETYWGEPTTDDETKLVSAQQDAALYRVITCAPTAT